MAGGLSPGCDAAPHPGRPGPIRLLALPALALAAGLALPAIARAHVALDEQIAGLGRRIGQAPRDAALYLKRGELHRAHGDWDSAGADYRRARRLDPGLDAVDLCRGRMLLESGRPAKAERILSRFLQRHPDHPEALVWRARARARLGRDLEAARDYSRAIDACRPPRLPDPDHYLERARALAGAGEAHLEEALRGLDEGIATLGPLVSLGLEAVDLAVRLGDFDGALARLERLDRGSPRQEAWLWRRAAVLERAGRTDEARRACAGTLAAIALLPGGRRSTRSIMEIEANARAALARLSSSVAPAPSAAAVPSAAPAPGEEQ